MTRGQIGRFSKLGLLDGIMSLRTVVAVPFQATGRTRLPESEFVVALSLDRDWFSPDQAAQVSDRAVGHGLLRRDDDKLVAEFSPETVSIPPDYSPSENILAEPSPFEEVLERFVESGRDKQSLVADINQLQADLAVTLDAAAVLYAYRDGYDVQALAERALATLRD